MFLDLLLSRAGIFATICMIASSALLYVHHQGALSERMKTQKSNIAIIKRVERAKDAINSIPHSDSASIVRLRAGTF